MAATEDDLFARLEELGIETTTVRHPPVFTVEQNKALRGSLTGGHAKNLFLKDKKGQLWMVVAEEDRAIDLKDLRRRIGAAHLSFAKPDVLLEVLGVEPGSVTPFAVINDANARVRVVLDVELMDEERLNFHPLANTATTAISPSDLVSFLTACGNAPEIRPLGDGG